MVTLASKFFTLYGPAPTAFRVPPNASSLNEAGEIIIPAVPPSQYSICPFGAFSLSLMLSVSTTSNDDTSAKVSATALPARLPNAVLRSKLRRTASAFTGVPSWNVTPGRMCSVSSVRSSLRVQESANPGPGTPASSSRISVS